jgi:hypothetical protein
MMTWEEMWSIKAIYLIVLLWPTLPNDSQTLVTILSVQSINSDTACAHSHI